MSTVVAPAAACRPSAACRPPGVPPLIFTCLSSPGTKHIIYLTHTHEKTLIIFGLSLLSLHFVFLLLHMLPIKQIDFLDMYCTFQNSLEFLDSHARYSSLQFENLLIMLKDQKENFSDFLENNSHQKKITILSLCKYVHMQDVYVSVDMQQHVGAAKTIKRQE